MQTVFISEPVINEIIRYAQDAYPNEAGGMAIEWRSGGILQQIHYEIPNVHPSPAHNYAGLDSATIGAYETSNTFDGGRISFSWHSHPTTPAVPSQIDWQVHHPHNVLVLVSLTGHPATWPDVRAWNMKNPGSPELSWVAW